MLMQLHQQAGRAFDDLGSRLRVIAEEAAPVVESVTALPLPEPIVIRTMTTRAWKRAHGRRARRLVMAEWRELDPRGDDARAASFAVKQERVWRRQNWPVIAAQTVDFESGQPEIVILAESLRHQDRLDASDALTKVIAHELTHLAQYQAGGGAVWQASKSYFKRLRGTADRNYNFLLEGHAYWTDGEVTTKLLGSKVELSRAPGASDIVDKALETAKPVLKGNRVSEEAVADVIAVCGIDIFNQIWTNPDLIPTHEDTKSPDAWARRFTGAAGGVR
ncbi:hypothetical protein ABT301_12345 [Streptomyces sp. NPDC000987]|uniref:hypothetical protein n=1 Tax=Streptomyces sp. NPDC000987 TaxID=3154374 RepID=UPI00332EAB0F